MNDYDVELLIDQNVREQIRRELSSLSEEEKDLYDIKSRYSELYDLAEQDYLDDIYYDNSKLELNDPNKW